MNILKSIGIVTNSNSLVAEFLKSSVENIYKGFVVINNYYLNELKSTDKIDDDVILIMNHGIAIEIERYVKNKKNIIVIERTIKENEVYKIFNIPQGTKALVVNNAKSATLETISLLYRIGVNNITLIPYDENQNYENIKFAITPGEVSRVPKYIEKVIDIGNRCIDISTFINISNKLMFKSRVIDTRLFKYSEKIVNLDIGIKDKYKELYIKNEDLNAVLNMSKEGIIFTDLDGRISFYNNAFEKLFNIRENIKCKNIKNVLDKNLVCLLGKNSVKDELIEYRDKFIVVNKEIVNYYGQKKGCYISISEVTYLEQLAKKLTLKYTNKGLIARYDFNSIKTNSNSIKECIKLGNKVAKSDLTVLITGESGTGKELFAQSIHNASLRKNRPFVAINCAAVPESLLESELFGYESGAFTGARKEGKAGLFEQANMGTIFLDEIGDMPLTLQARLLRVLQEKQVMRIGSDGLINVDIRVIAATNKNLLQMIEKGQFRKDLFYRINVLPINIPPVRERKEDIISLIKYFMGRKKTIRLSDEVIEIFMNYSWPGNIREIQNVASYIKIMTDDEEVKARDLPYYLVDYNIDFDKEITYLKSKNCILDSVLILKIVKEQGILKSGIGRKSIKKIMETKNIKLSEAEIRRIMSILNKLSLITCNLGRSGSKITTKGDNFLKWMENRVKL
ncbi:sigma 54-interacting transcriptional regulator [Clostridium sp. AWRP]|uniref:sigma-54 interaction domain-containing protein n=1 Tax=Clostridium sp. AWRP TaxID=2212991 RepID=UPI00325BBE3B